MTNQIGIVWSADDRELMASLHRQMAEMSKENQSLRQLAETGKLTARQIVDAFRKVERGTSDAGREADNVRRLIRTKMEAASDEYRKGMAKLRSLHASGALSDAEYAKGREFHQKKFLDDSGISAERRAAAQRLADDKAAGEKSAAQRQAQQEKEQAQRNAHHEKMRTARRTAMQQELEDRRSSADQVRSLIRSKEDAAFQEYKSSMARLRAMRATGDLSNEEFQQAWQREKQRYQESIGLTEKRQRAERRAAVEKRRNEREAADLIKATMTMQEQHNKRVERYQELMRKGLISQQQYSNAVRQSTEMMHGQQTSMQQLGAAASRYLATWLSIQTAVRIAGAEMQAVRDRQKAAGETQASYGETMFDVVMNYGPTPNRDKTIDEIDQRVKGISKSEGAMPQKVLQTFGKALATRVGGTVEDSYQATEMAYGLTSKSEDADFIAAAALAWRAQHKQMTMGEIAGKMAAAKVIHPTATNQQFAEHVAPAIAVSKIYGDSIEEASALFSGIAAPMSDTEGRVSTSATIGLQKQLMERMPKLKSTRERMLALQKPEYAPLRQELLGGLDDKVAEASDLYSNDPIKLEGEKKGIGVLIQAVRGDKEWWDRYNEFLESMPKSRKEAEDEFESLKTTRRTNRKLAASELKRRTESRIELNKLEDPGAIGGITREFLKEELRTHAGNTLVGNTLKSIEFEIDSHMGGKKPISALIKQLTHDAAIMESPRTQTRHFRGDTESSVDEIVPQTEENLRKAKELREFIDEIKPLLRLEGSIQDKPPETPPAPEVKVSVNVMMPGIGEKAPLPPVAGLASIG